MFISSKHLGDSNVSGDFISKDKSYTITYAEAETPVLWPPHAKRRLIGKDPDAGRDWGQEEKGTTEDEMAGWITDSMDMGLSKLRELVMDREAWGRKESDRTEQLN